MLWVNGHATHVMDNGSIKQLQFTCDYYLFKDTDASYLHNAVVARVFFPLEEIS